MEIDNKKIVITGAASGIGKSLLEDLSKYDCEIIAIDKDKSIKNISQKLNNKAKIDFFICDVSDKKNIDDLFSFSIKKMGCIDIFIANAGFAYYEKIEKPCWGRIENVYKTNVFSPIYSLEKMNEKQKDFLFVVISSSIGFLAIPGYSLYSSTKSALNMFFDSYKFEKNKGCKILVVYPIGTKTNIFANAGKNVPEPLIMQDSEYVSRKIIKAIKKSSNKLFTSTLFKIFKFINKFFPFIFKSYQLFEKRKFIRWMKENK